MYKKSFLSGSLLSMIEQGFSSVTSFLTTIIIAHSCSMQTAGQYALILSLSLIVLGLQRVIIAVPFSVHYPKYAEGSEKKRYYASTFSLEFIFLIAAGIISLFLGGKQAILQMESHSLSFSSDTYTKIFPDNSFLELVGLGIALL